MTTELTRRYNSEAGIYYKHVTDNYSPLPGERIFRYKWTYLPTKTIGFCRIVALANDIFPLINRWNQAENWKYELC